MFWDKKSYKPPKKTLYDFFMYLFNLYYERRAMWGYWRENHNLCTTTMEYPSKKLIKRYNLNPADIHGFSWWLMEQYFEGNLILKQKEDVQSIK